MNAPTQSTLSIEQLIDAWKEAKHEETEAKDLRLSIEQMIIERTELKPEGTTKLPGLAIVCGHIRTWDQRLLSGLVDTIKPEFWPFKIEYKEDRKASKLIEERFPDLWKQINRALELSPKKPAFRGE